MQDRAIEWYSESTTKPPTNSLYILTTILVGSKPNLKLKIRGPNYDSNEDNKLSNLDDNQMVINVSISKTVILVRRFQMQDCQIVRCQILQESSVMDFVVISVWAS